MKSQPPDSENSSQSRSSGGTGRSPGLEADGSATSSADLEGFGCAVAASIREIAPGNLSSLLNETEFKQTLDRIRRLESPCTADTLSHIGALTTDAEAPPIPRRLANHDLCCQIGQGGMGVVYLARNRGLKSFRAIKLLSPERINSPKAVARFRQEFVKTGLISDIPDAGFVTAYDAGEENGWHYLVMDYIDGQDLAASVWKHGPLPLGAAAEIVRRAALSLAKAHEHPDEPVHRDLKPSNMMLTPDGQVRILDFGLTRIAQDAADESMKGGGIVGTLQYMAPEQLRGEDTVDPRADIYALGATFFHLLTGRPPHTLKSSQTRAEQVIARLTEPARSIREACPDFPEPLAALIESMLSESTTQRPQSMQTVADDVARFASEDELQAWATETVTAQLPALSASRPETVSVEHQSEPQQEPLSPTKDASGSSHALRGLVAIVITAGVALAGFSWFSKGRHAAERLDQELSTPLVTGNPTDLTPNGDISDAPPPITPWPDEATLKEIDQSYPPPSEPPPLEDWLAGKEILTVKQDGTADFKTIKAALQTVRDNQVIEILDTGPYAEAISKWRFPSRSGVFSRVGTVVIPDQWHKGDEFSSVEFNIHNLTAGEGFRASGLNFHWESVAGTGPLGFYACGELVIENCAFTQCGATILADGIKPPVMQFAEVNLASNEIPFRLTIRDCVIATQLTTALLSSSNAHSQVIVTRNLFKTNDEHVRLIATLDLDQAETGQFYLSSNVFDCPHWPLAVVIRNPNPELRLGNLFCDRNTFHTGPDRGLIQFWGPGSTRKPATVSVTRNLVAADPTTWLAMRVDHAEHIRFNVVPAQHPHLPTESQTVVQAALPLDASLENYMRLSAASDVTESIKLTNASYAPGALSLDDPDRKPDWFDLLRERWLEQSEVNKELEPRLLAVPRPE